MKIFTLFILILFLSPRELRAWEIFAENTSLMDDGNIFFENPYIVDQGKKWFISSEASHLNTLCKTYGLNSVVTSFSEKKEKKLAALESNRILKINSDPSLRIQRLVCSANEQHFLTQLSHTYQEITYNPDLTITLNKPQFRVSDNETLNYSASSHADGICKLYGYERSIEQPIMLHHSSGLLLVTIRRDGTLGEFEKTNTYLSAVRCSRRLPYRLFLSLDLEQAPQSLEELAFALEPAYAKYLREVGATLKIQNKIETWKRGRTLRKEMIGVVQIRNMIHYLFLEPFLEQMDSTWFQDQVIPVLQKRKKEIFYFIGVNSVQGLERNATNLEIAFYELVAALKAIKPDVNNVENTQWLNRVVAASGNFLSSSQGPNELKKWATVWDQGDSAREAWVTGGQTNLLASQVEFLGSWIKSCK